LQNKSKKLFVLDRPDVGLFMPELCWHSMEYSHNAVQVVVASNRFSENDYIRNYDQFFTFRKNK
jgi:hypothetical protein